MRKKIIYTSGTCPDPDSPGQDHNAGNGRKMSTKSQMNPGNNGQNTGGDGGKNNDNFGNGGNKKSGKGPGMILIIILATALTLGAIAMVNSLITGATYKQTPYNEFYDHLKNDEVDTVTYKDDRIQYTLKSETQSELPSIQHTYYTGIVGDEDLVPTMKRKGVTINGYIPNSGSSVVNFIFVWVLPLVIMYIFMMVFFRRIGKGGGLMGIGKSNAKIYEQKDTGVTFKDVAGQDEAKESLVEVVDFLHNPKKYTAIGAKLPKGALLVGPPGTGKTLIAKAVAGEAGVPFFSLAGSDFVEMFVGVGASRVRDLFSEAQKQAPAIIFIDEIDAIGKSRDTRFGGNDEREQTLNQLLSEMDGFDSSKGVFILAATNRPEVLDKALLRPGRLDRRIIVDKPDLRGRVEVLKVHAKNVRMDDTVDLDEIALATSGAVGSDLANMINEAAIAAVKAGRKAVSQADLWEAVEVVVAGKEKKDRILSTEEKKTVAYHEVGHALVTAVMKNSEPVQKITIVPRTMGTLGYVMQVPEEEKYLMNKDEMLTRLTTLLAGRAAEEIVFGKITTGAANDIEQATKLARAMVTQYGMSEEFGLMGLETIENEYLDGRAVRNCSDETETIIDNEIKNMLKECYAHAKELLGQNREALDGIAGYLFEKETITGKEFMTILAQYRPIPEENIIDETPAT